MRTIPRNIQRILEHKMVCLQAFDQSAEFLGIDAVTLARLMRGGRIGSLVTACRHFMDMLSKRPMDSRTAQLMRRLRSVVAPIEEHMVGGPCDGDPT